MTLDAKTLRYKAQRLSRGEGNRGTEKANVTPKQNVNDHINNVKDATIVSPSRIRAVNFGASRKSPGWSPTLQTGSVTLTVEKSRSASRWPKWAVPEIKRSPMRREDPERHALVPGAGKKRYEIFDHRPRRLLPPDQPKTVEINWWDGRSSSPWTIGGGRFVKEQLSRI